MANITYTITQNGEEIAYTINDGVGPIGPAGPEGPAGPNNLTTSTTTDINGIIKGDGANVGAAVADTDYQSVPAEGAFADGDKTKLDGIESGADVTDATNVNAAGAVMESDYSPAHSVLAQQSGTGSPSAVTLGTNAILGRTTGAGTAITGLSASDVRTMLNVEDGATADQTASEILTAIKTVDGTGSGLDADLLDGQDSTAFATSAQGALADSAVQPGDIDTLAELNAIITDATLIDTTDSRLSDARTPTAHTHTVEDLDFAGSTDISADLADADEILVSDGGGNTTRRKSALSRVWTYIKAKIESVALSTLEITGNLTVNNIYASGGSASEVNLSSGYLVSNTNFSTSIDWDTGLLYDMTTGNHSLDYSNRTFRDNGGTDVAEWYSDGLKADTLDEYNSPNLEPLLHLSTGYLGRYGPHQIDFKNGTVDSYNGSTFAPVIDYGSQVLYDGFGTQILNWSSGIDFTSTPTLTGDFNASGQVELTGQSASTDDSAMTYGLTQNHIDLWGDMYFNVNGETDTNNKFSITKSGDRLFHMFAYTGSAAGDGQWVDFISTSYGIPYGSGAKGQLRDKWSFKFKFDSNTTTNTDAHLWFVRGKAANATLPTASDVCFALKFEGEEDLMIAVYDGVTAHTTTIDLSTINTHFTNLAAQQEYMWTWSGTQAKVYGRYRLPAGSGVNDWSAWFTIGTLTPSGMAASTTNLTTANAYFLQHTPVTTTGFTKSFFIWDVMHTSNVIIPN